MLPNRDRQEAAATFITFGGPKAHAEHPKMGPDVDTRRAKGFDGKEQAIALDEKAGKIL